MFYCLMGCTGLKLGARKQLTLGRLPALAWSDQSPVTGAQCLPFPSLRLSWKPRLAGSRERWVPGPLPSPSPPSPCQAWHLPRPGLSQDKEELSRAVLPGLDLLPGKMKIAPRGVGGAGWNFFGLCSGWGFLEGQMWSTVKLMCIESVLPSNHLILSCPLLLPPSILPSIRVFSNESALHIR